MSGNKSTAEILAIVKASMARRAAESDNQNVQGASIKDMRADSDLGEKNLDQGAHLLSTLSKDKLLKGCAPDGAGNASSEVAFIKSEEPVNGHAASLSLATTASEVEVDSLGSSTEEKEVLNGFAKLNPQLDADHPANFDTDFYEIRTDLFDNSGSGKKSTMHRAKLTVRANPTTRNADANVFMLDFYNRSRDINKRLREMEVEDDEWYAFFKGEFSRYEKMLVAYEIPPKLAVLKEIDQSDKSSEILGYAAGIMFQIKNQEPMVILFYGASRYELALDFSFTRKPGSPIFKKGIYRDSERQHLDVETTATKAKLKIKTARDFS